MDTLSAIAARRSVKLYDSAHRLTENEERQLFEAAMLSPTSFNLQHWRFVAVKDAELRAKIKAASWNQAQVTDCSLLVLICADLQAWAKEPERYWRDAPEAARHSIVPAIGSVYNGNAQLQRDEAMRSVGIAGQTLMLAAKAMGYDSCPMIGFNAQTVAELINLPGDHVIGLMVTIGKAAQQARPRSGQLSLDEVLIYDRF